MVLFWKIFLRRFGGTGGLCCPSWDSEGRLGRGDDAGDGVSPHIGEVGSLAQQVVFFASCHRVNSRDVSTNLCTQKNKTFLDSKARGLRLAACGGGVCKLTFCSPYLLIFFLRRGCMKHKGHTERKDSACCNLFRPFIVHCSREQQKETFPSLRD